MFALQLIGVDGTIRFVAHRDYDGLMVTNAYQEFAALFDADETMSALAQIPQWFPGIAAVIPIRHYC